MTTLNANKLSYSIVNQTAMSIQFDGKSLILFYYIRDNRKMIIS